ncbi:hypothetical protein EVAR_93468_1 [Eumeta japonica]|uniref:Uncharacterized protein n=1 Tax=Eumeta variegata TaxID=151549 RepID=A0A4C1TKL4_EUMVA|nr:hypothetical protein EVAR_93468_1 [Eumeta japonica]
MNMMILLLIIPKKYQSVTSQSLLKTELAIPGPSRAFKQRRMSKKEDIVKNRLKDAILTARAVKIEGGKVEIRKEHIKIYYQFSKLPENFPAVNARNTVGSLGPAEKSRADPTVSFERFTVTS